MTPHTQTEQRFYNLPDLPYSYDALEPYISAELLKIHHLKHHTAYVQSANAILEKLDRAKTEDLELNFRAELKALAYAIGGHMLHSLYWTSLTPNNDADQVPPESLERAIGDTFGDFNTFIEKFSRVAMSVEGSGWAALAYCPRTERLLPMQIEKHNVNLYPTFPILMAIDVFEHAYYLDYVNDRAKYLEGIWHVIDWQSITERYEQARSANHNHSAAYREKEKTHSN